MKQIEVVAAIIRKDDKIFATLRGLASDKAAIKREESDARISSAMPLGLSKNYPEREQARTKFK